jgi:hypothetical protein
MMRNLSTGNPFLIRLSLTTDLGLLSIDLSEEIKLDVELI